MDKKDNKIILGKDFLDYIFKIVEIKDTMASISSLRYVMRAIMAGIIVSFGYVAYILIDSNFEAISFAGTSLKPLGHFFSAWVFGFCLIFIYYAKAELLTSNMMVVTVAKYFSKITWKKGLKIFVLCYLGNLLGGIFVGLLLAKTTMISSTPGAIDYMNHVLTVKQGYIANGAYWDLFVRAIFCNFFINLAMVMVYSGNIKSDGVKALVMFGGVFFFMYLGLEHSVANTVFFAVAAMQEGTVFNLFLGSMNVIIVLLGNFVGGGILIGTYYAFLNDKKQLNK